MQGMSEAKACAEIKNKLVQKGYNTPLVADIHFAPKVALAVAECFDKIRINPGNFADGRKKFEQINYEDEKEYQAELDYIEEVRRTRLSARCAHLRARQRAEGEAIPPVELPGCAGAAAGGHRAASACPCTGVHSSCAEVQGKERRHAHRHQPRQPFRAVSGSGS